jgi:MFS superfamily sulfate permease-like transporter
MFFQGQLRHLGSPGFSLPPLTSFRPREVWDGLVLAGFAQIPLTATNAVIATASLIRKYWPDRPVSEQQLSLNQGVMNVILPFFGGMPLCHGAGGLAGQYYFGARTGGTNIIEGLIEISLGLFLATTIAGLFTAFPTAIIGAMMLLVGIELTKFAKEIRIGRDMVPLAVTLIAALAGNMALGFLAGMGTHYLIGFVSRKRMVQSLP